jgi:AraC-like DNA-binding protein
LLESLVALTLAEARVNRAGSACTRIGLSELMFVEAVRHYFETLPAEQSGWLAGLRDPAVGRALTLLHDRPSHPWTLEELASQSGMSRASLAKRFAETVGCPPMWYLKLWRLQIAAQILSDGPTKVAAVAHEVGYESEAHFSRAFKKATGLPPSEWRKRVVVHRSK